MLKERKYSKYTQDAAVLLGKYIQLARKERGFSEENLANRAGISRLTVRKIEKGDLKCEIGLVFEVATLVGVNLFDVDATTTIANTLAFSASINRVNDKLALLPKSIRKKKGVDDAF